MDLDPMLTLDIVEAGLQLVYAIFVLILAARSRSSARLRIAGKVGLEGVYLYSVAPPPP